jgi:hypothetical protein
MLFVKKRVSLLEERLNWAVVIWNLMMGYEIDRGVWRIEIIYHPTQVVS